MVEERTRALCVHYFELATKLSWRNREPDLFERVYDLFQKARGKDLAKLCRIVEKQAGTRGFDPRGLPVKGPAFVCKCIWISS